MELGRTSENAGDLELGRTSGDRKQHGKTSSTFSSNNTETRLSSPSATGYRRGFPPCPHTPQAHRLGRAMLPAHTPGHTLIVSGLWGDYRFRHRLWHRDGLGICVCSGLWHRLQGVGGSWLGSDSGMVTSSSAAQMVNDDPQFTSTNSGAKVP